MLARGHVNRPVGAVRHSWAAFLAHPLRWVGGRGEGRHGAWTCTIMLLQALSRGEGAMMACYSEEALIHIEGSRFRIIRQRIIPAQGELHISYLSVLLLSKKCSDTHKGHFSLVRDSSFSSQSMLAHPAMSTWRALPSAEKQSKKDARATLKACEGAAPTADSKKQLQSWLGSPCTDGGETHGHPDSRPTRRWR